MTPRIVWFPDVPHEIRQQFEPYLMAHLHVLPSWVLEVRIAWDAAGGGALMTRIDYEYRVGTLWIHAKWLDGDDQYRHEAIVHELAHFALDALHAYAFRLINLSGADGKWAEHLKEEVRLALEQTTVDVAEMISRASNPSLMLP